MKNSTTQIKSIIENTSIFDNLRNASNANPNLEVQEMSYKEGFEILSDLRNLFAESIEKGVMDEISFTSRNAILSHLTQIQRFNNDPNRLLPQIGALQYQVQISDLKKRVFEGIKIEFELQELTNLKRRYTVLLKEIENAEKVKKDFQTIDSNVKELIQSIEKVKTQSDNYKKLLTTIQNEIEESKTSIIKSEQDVENKKSEILEFAKNINLFKESLEKIQNELNVNIESILNNKISKANDLIEQAEKALELKSTEGISAAYSSRLKKLSDENSKRNWLLGSIGFLLVTFITGYLLTGGQIKLGAVEIGFNPTDNIAFIIGRILLTAIGISGAAFCANRYVQIRNLEEDYEYKVVLSKSILAFGNKIKELDDKKIADYLNKVLNDLHQDPLRDRKNKKEKETDIDALNKMTELLKNWKDMTSGS